MKAKNIYCVCTLEYSVLDDDSDIKELFKKSTIGELKDIGIQYLTQFHSLSGGFSSCDEIAYEEVLKYDKLSDLIGDFIYGSYESEEDFIADDESEESIQEREDSLGIDYLILRINKETRRVSVVSQADIKNCIKLLDEELESEDNEFVSDICLCDDCMNSVISEYPNYLVVFKEKILMCFGCNKSGSIGFFDGHSEWRCDIYLVDGDVKFGIDGDQNEFFSEFLVGFYLIGGVCMVRIFTEQKIGGLIATELYSFILYPSFDIKTIPHDELFASHTKDCENGDKIEPEVNVIYCDIEGGRTFV